MQREVARLALQPKILSHKDAPDYNYEVQESFPCMYFLIFLTLNPYDQKTEIAFTGSFNSLHKKRSFSLRISSVMSYLLKKSLMENFIFCAVI